MTQALSGPGVRPQPGRGPDTAGSVDLALQPIIKTLDCLPDPVLLVDDALMVVGMNGAAVRRYTADSVARPLVGLLRQPMALECMEQVRADRVPRDVVITEIRHATECKMRLVVAPLTLDKSSFNGFCLSLADITTVREAEQARKDFVANVSHELKSPLTTLIGFIDTIDEDPDIDARTLQGFLDVMKAESARMSRLVSELLALSKVEAQENIRPTATVPICALVASLAEGYIVASNGCPSRITLTDCRQELLVLGDDDQLRQVIANLVDNALKYSPPDSPVELRCRRSDSHQGGAFAIIEVRDCGPGIDADHLPRLTERFYRIDSHRSQQQGGAGLGLAIVKHILNRHRARLEINSAQGEGSVFRVHIPLVPESRPTPATADEFLTGMT